MTFACDVNACLAMHKSTLLHWQRLILLSSKAILRSQVQVVYHLYGAGISIDCKARHLHVFIDSMLSRGTCNSACLSALLLVAMHDLDMLFCACLPAVSTTLTCIYSDRQMLMGTPCA